jgi:hypothetical protein
MLGVIRVLTGLLALYAIAAYGPDLDRWFGPGGMLPVTMVRGLYDSHWSALDYLPPNMLWPAFWATLAAIALLTLGIGGRVVACWPPRPRSASSRGRRCSFGEFEPILALLMVYLCVGRAVDSSRFPLADRQRASNLAPRPALLAPSNTIAIRLIQIHIAIVHLMMGWAQLAAPEGAWWSGEGIWLAATRPGMALIDLSILKEHPRIVAAWSHLITLYLLAMPMLVWSRLARPLVLAIGVLAWISLAVASGWLMFCLAMLIGLLAFVERGENSRLSAVAYGVEAAAGVSVGASPSSFGVSVGRSHDHHNHQQHHHRSRRE